jgi:hypothetical protein
VADDKDRGFETQEERRGYDRSRLIVDVFFDGKDVTASPARKTSARRALHEHAGRDSGRRVVLVRIPFRRTCRWFAMRWWFTAIRVGVGLRFQGLSDDVRHTRARSFQWLK